MRLWTSKACTERSSIHDTARPPEINRSIAGILRTGGSALLAYDFIFFSSGCFLYLEWGEMSEKGFW